MLGDFRYVEGVGTEHAGDEAADRNAASSMSATLRLSSTCGGRKRDVHVGF